VSPTRQAGPKFEFSLNFIFTMTSLYQWGGLALISTEKAE
jgi:hypothetical protein